jgi:hypothetical protein
MNHKARRVFISGLILVLISACGLLNRLNPFGGVAPDVEELAEQIPVEEIQKEVEALTTDLPGDLEALATDLPDDLGQIEDVIGDLGDIDEVGDLLGEGGEIPADIPVVEDPKEELFSSDKIVSYLTPLDFDSVLSFYQAQMLEHSWTPKDGSVIADDAALLYYEKPDRQVTITMSFNPVDSQTAVMIIIQQKE